MTITSADVARRAGLSRSTVTQVLNGQSHRFAAETAQRVLRAAEELGLQAVGRRSDAADRVQRFRDRIGPQHHLRRQPAGHLRHRHGPPRREGPHARAPAWPPSRRHPWTASSRECGHEPYCPCSPSLTPSARCSQERDIPGFDTTTGGNLNYEIGRLQAEHLVARGYRRIAFAHLRDNRLDPYGTDREVAVRDVCASRGTPGTDGDRPGNRPERCLRGARCPRTRLRNRLLQRRHRHHPAHRRQRSAGGASPPTSVSSAWTTLLCPRSPTRA